MEYFSSNLSSFVNSTDLNLNLNWYCIRLSVGPLIWGIFSVPCAFVGLPACVWLLCVITKGKQNGSASTTYMLNLTVMDLIFNMFILPVTINFFYWKNNEFERVSFVLYCFNLTGRPLLTACICVDCYMAVVYPVLFLKIKHSRYRLVVSALVWTLTVVYGSVMTMYIQMATVTWVLCAFAVVTISFCDFIVLLTLKKPDPSGRSGVHPQKQRALQIITNSLAMTLVSYLPMLILNGVSVILPLSPQRACDIMSLALISSMLGSSVMALLHLKNLGSFKDLKSFLCAPSHQASPQGQLRPTG